MRISLPSLGVLGIALALLLTLPFGAITNNSAYGAIYLSALLFAFVLKVIFHSHLISLFIFLCTSHGIEDQGMGYTRLVLIGVLWLSVFIDYPKLSTTIRKRILLSWFWIALYFILIFLIRPYKFPTLWLLLYIQSAALFSLSISIQWTKTSLQNFVFAHLCFISIWGISEGFITGIDRVGGPFFSPTAYGVLLAVEWTIWISLSLLNPKRNYVLISLFSLLILISILFSGTRMALMGLVIGPAILFSTKNFISSKGSIMLRILKIIMIITLIVLSLILLWKILPSDLIIKQRFESMLNGKIDDSNYGRLLAWYTAIEVIDKNTLFGIGPGNFYSYMFGVLQRPEVQVVAARMPALIHAHNIYLIVLSEYGIFGAFFLGLFICYGFLTLLRFTLSQVENHIGFSMISGLGLMLILGLVDAIPMFPSSFGVAAVLMGLLFQLQIQQNAPLNQNLSKTSRI